MIKRTAIQHGKRGRGLCAVAFAAMLSVSTLLAAPAVQAQQDGLPTIKVEGVTINPSDQRVLYATDGGQWIWFNGWQLNRRGADLLRLFDEAETEGLTPARYMPDRIRARIRNATRDNLGDTEMLMTAMAIRYLNDIRLGRPVPEVLLEDMRLPKQGRDFDPIAVLRRGLVSGDLSRTMLGAAPDNDIYDALRLELGELIHQRDQQETITIPGGRVMRQGREDARLPDLRRRLNALGYAAGWDDDPDTYFGPEITEAVKEFQRDNGLGVDGAVGPRTLSVLNRSVEDNIRVLVANLERLRWMQYDLTGKRVEVNIPEARLVAYDEYGLPDLDMRVIVGRSERPTPMFSSVLNDITFFPYWHAPKSIATKDLLPKIQQDVSFIERNGYEVIQWGRRGQPVVQDAYAIDWGQYDQEYFPYTLRQDPGKGNALGMVRFGVVNDLAIFLHDTPTAHLFNRSRRFYSSGCVRVVDPVAFANYVLAENQDWDASRIDDQFSRGRQRGLTPEHFALRRKIDLHLMYMTALPDENGRIQYLDDVYGWDRITADSLMGPRGRQARL